MHPPGKNHPRRLATEVGHGGHPRDCLEPAYCCRLNSARRDNWRSIGVHNDGPRCSGIVLFLRSRRLQRRSRHRGRGQRPTCDTISVICFLHSESHPLIISTAQSWPLVPLFLDKYISDNLPRSRSKNRSYVFTPLRDESSRLRPAVLRSRAHVSAVIILLDRMVTTAPYRRRRCIINDGMHEIKKHVI